MHKPEKAPEPSMEEILASIRKIIAEEPIGSRPGPLPPAPGPRGGTGPSSLRERIEPTGFPLGAPQKSEQEAPYSVEDALADLIDDAPLRGGPAPGKSSGGLGGAGRSVPQSPAAPALDEPQRPSWLFARPGAAAAPPPAAPAVSTPGRIGGLAGSSGGHRPPIGPDPAPDLKPEIATTGAHGSLAEAAAKSPAQPDGAAGPAARQAANGSGKPSIPGVPAADAPPRPSVPNPSAQQQANELKAEHKAPLARGPADQASYAEKGPDKGPEPALRNADPAQPQAPVPAARKESSPLDDLAKGLAAARLDAAPGQPPSADPAPAPDAAPTADLPAPAGASQPARSLEDTVADLLRPMLRDWLEANMPRIVEKALRVELAESVKRPAEPT